MKARQNNKTYCFIHGWGIGSGVWDRFLDNRPHDWQTCVLDLPGYRSVIPATVTNDDIESIADYLIDQCPDNAILVGWSLGGMIAIELAARMANKVFALVLLSSTACFVRKPDWPHGIDVDRLLQVAGKLKKDSNSAVNDFAAEAACGDVSPRNTIRLLREVISKKPASKEALAGGLEILRCQDLRDSLGNVRCPIGMISGKNDHLIAETTGEALQALHPDIHLIKIEDVGHAPFVSQQEKTIRAINKLTEKFLCMA